MALGLVVCPVPSAEAQTTTEVVITWNRVIQVAVGTPGAQPATIFFPRAYAMAHVAMFDAINSIEPRYVPYFVRVNAPPGASPDAAVAQAAYDVLVALMPSQRAAFDTALAATMSSLSPAAAADGAAVGAAVAREILELRRHDGWTRVPPQYILPNLPGYWQPTPPNNPTATFTHYPDVVPFGVDGGSQEFVPEAPPALTSARYAQDFNEVKALGGVTSTARTAEQTFVARLISGVGTETSPAIVWNNVARDVARSQGLSGIETARLFALLTMAVHDGLRVTFNGKFLYGLWRPATAIRNADRDGNPDTEADPTWLSLITTPPYPAYPGNLACIGTVGSRVLTRVLGRDDIPFTVNWAETGGPGWTRSYNGFRHFGDETAKGRIWAGLHFEF
ncbi:MAG: vanadium-dependent haloperoxidase, partial [Luteitalea sp.]